MRILALRQLGKLYRSTQRVGRETAALGESLGLPTKGDSTLPESDRIDDLTHRNPADVDDRLGALNTFPKGAITTSVESMLPEILADDDTPLLDEDEPAPTPAQMAAYGEKTAELLKALKDALAEISQLRAENLKLREAKASLTK